MVPAATQQQQPPPHASNDKAAQATATAPTLEQEGAGMEVEKVGVVEALRAAGGEVAKAGACLDAGVVWRVETQFTSQRRGGGGRGAKEIDIRH